MNIQSFEKQRPDSHHGLRLRVHCFHGLVTGKPVAIVFARYMMLALENRMQKDDRSIGELFFHNCDELSDITWIESFSLLMETFLEVSVEKYFLADDEIESLLEAFMAALPEPLENRLLQCS
jgi:hypothetical protein